MASRLVNTSTSIKQSAQLKLTSYQQKKIDTISQNYSAEVRDLQAELTARKQELSKLIADPKSGDETIRTAVYDVSDVQAELQLAAILAQRAKNKVYTPGQRELLSKPSASSACGCGGSATQIRATASAVTQGK